MNDRKQEDRRWLKLFRRLSRDWSGTGFQISDAEAVYTWTRKQHERLRRLARERTGKDCDPDDDPDAIDDLPPDLADEWHEITNIEVLLFYFVEYCMNEVLREEPIDFRENPRELMREWKRRMDADQL